MDSEAVAQCVGEFEAQILRCDCGKPRSHAPYIDGQRRRNFMRRLRARLLRRQIINVPCPTPRVEAITVTGITIDGRIRGFLGG